MLKAVLLAPAVRFHHQRPHHHLRPLPIDLSGFIATRLILWQRTAREHFRRLARFWTKKVFAVSFAMGVVSGIPMSYEFGSNWSRFYEVAGNLVGPLVGYEVLTAFFLEAISTA